MFVYIIPMLLIITLAENSEDKTIEQATNEMTQFRTLSFDCLSFITGNLCSDSFIPPGKVADYFGFQHLRDNTENGQGHNTDFLTVVANNVLNILDATQVEMIIYATANQFQMVNNYASGRYPLMKAFRRQLEGTDLPANSVLNQDEVMGYSAKLYQLDIAISISRALTFSQIFKTLTDQQIYLLKDMRSGGFENWEKMLESDKIDRTKLFNDDQFTLIMTYCSEMFSWLTGDITSDTYFCPERHANYFGSFYVKDAPAVKQDGFTIDEELTADAGQDFSDILTEQQYDKLWNLVKTTKNDLDNIVESRRNIAEKLRLYLIDGYDNINDVDIYDIAEESLKYGRYDGNISYHYTMVFTEISNELTDFQREQMYDLRSECLTSEDNPNKVYECPDDQIYKYAEIMDVPTIENTDHFFITTSLSYEQCVIKFEGGSDSSEFLNNLQWIKVDGELPGVDSTSGYYFMADNYYLYTLTNCRDDENANWWIIVDVDDNIFDNSNKQPCDVAIGRCKRSNLRDCDGNWLFKNIDGHGHTKNINFRILSMDETC